jgi:hypothetical protein
MRILVAASIAAVLAAPAAAAVTPVALSTQGYLLDPADVPVNADVTLGFSVWDDATATGDSARLWPSTGETTCPVKVWKGFYTAFLDGSKSTGCGAGLNAEAITAAPEQWLQISVAGETMQQRIRIGAVPSAAFAEHARDAQALIAQLAGTGTVNASGNPVDWTQLKHVPAGLADGTDDGNSYDADNVTIVLDGTTFGVKTGGIGAGELASSTASLAKVTGGKAAIDGNGDFTFSGSLTAATGKKFNGDGSGLSALDASMLAAGTLADARLSNNVPLLNGSPTFTGSAGVTAPRFNGKAVGDGSEITALNAANISSGALNDARLSANIPRLGATSSQQFAGALGGASLFSLGGIQIGNDAGACNSGKAGSIRWTGSIFEVCLGGPNWRALTGSAAGHRYWRSYKTSAALSGGYHTELEVSDANGVITVTSDKLTQSNLQAWVPAQLVDGNTGSNGFHTDSAGPGAYMEIDFGLTGDKALNKWRYYSASVNNSVWNIQYSDDRNTWTSAYTGLNVAGNGWNQAAW